MADFEDLEAQRKGLVSVALNTADLRSVLTDLRSEIDRVSVLGALGPERAELLLERIQTLARSVRTVHSDPGPADGADEHRVTLEVPQGLRDLLAALRAFDGDGELVLEGHELEGNPTPEGE